MAWPTSTTCLSNDMSMIAQQLPTYRHCKLLIVSHWASVLCWWRQWKGFGDVSKWTMSWETVTVCWNVVSWMSYQYQKYSITSVLVVMDKCLASASLKMNISEKLCLWVKCSVFIVHMFWRSWSLYCFPTSWIYQSLQPNHSRLKFCSNPPLIYVEFFEQLWGHDKERIGNGDCVEED